MVVYATYRYRKKDGKKMDKPEIAHVYSGSAVLDLNASAFDVASQEIIHGHEVNHVEHRHETNETKSADFIEVIGETDDGVLTDLHQREQEQHESEVKEWLELKVRLPEYYDVFINSGYESFAFIKEITNRNELEEIGIFNKMHQDIILAEIKQLNDELDRMYRMNNQSHQYEWMKKRSEGIEVAVNEQPFETPIGQ